MCVWCDNPTFYFDLVFYLTSCKVVRESWGKTWIDDWWARQNPLEKKKKRKRPTHTWVTRARSKRVPGVPAFPGRPATRISKRWTGILGASSARAPNTIVSWPDHFPLPVLIFFFFSLYNSHISTFPLFFFSHSHPYTHTLLIPRSQDCDTRRS